MNLSSYMDRAQWQVGPYQPPQDHATTQAILEGISILALASSIGILFLQKLRKASPRKWTETAITKLFTRRTVSTKCDMHQVKHSSSSFQSESGSESGDSSSGEEDDILACVSLLFQEDDEEDSEDEADFDIDRQRRDSGTIIARLIPRDCIDFEQKDKPVDARRNDHDDLRHLLQQQSLISMAASEFESKVDGVEDVLAEDHTKSLVALDVHLHVSHGPLDFKGQQRRANRRRDNRANNNMPLHMRMLREANEPAKRTLRRLHISIVKKIQHELNMGGHGLLHSRKKEGAAQQYQFHTTRRQKSLTTEPSVWVRDMGKDDFDREDDRDSSSGHLSLQKTPSQRKFSLTNNCIATPPAKEMHSYRLWEQLSDFESSELYLGIRPTGPLMRLDVDACPPTILKLDVFENFRSRIYTNVPLAVDPVLLHATRAIVAWFVEDEDGLSCRSCRCFPAANSNSTFTPDASDIGKFVSVLIIPMRPGHDGRRHEEAYRYENPVEPLPEMRLVSPLRDSWTLDRQSTGSCNHLRVMSYNLLADWYAGRHFEVQKTEADGNQSKQADGNFYTYCQSAFLRKSRRFPLLVWEILSVKPDLVCLQEVDASVFNTLLLPVLKSKGYQGFYSNKASVQLEGCAIFWSLDAFEWAETIDMHTLHLCDFFKDSATTERNGAWREGIEAVQGILDRRPELKEVVTSKVGQVLQVVALHPKPLAARNKPQTLVVGNTHLFYHPMADHVRVIQAYQVCHLMDVIRSRHCAGRNDAPVILCGDLNSHPLSGAVQLLLQGKIGPGHFEAWKNLNEYSWEMGGEDFLLEHGYIGGDQDGNEPAYVQEAFEDASEEFFEDANAYTVEPMSFATKEGGEINGSQVQDLMGMSADAVPTIQFPRSFPRLAIGYPQMPEFTNYSVGFEETLDYIFVSEPPNGCDGHGSTVFGLEPVSAAPIPSTDDMHREGYIAMPNEFMPSDHVSLVCDLAWKTSKFSKQQNHAKGIKSNK